MKNQRIKESKNQAYKLLIGVLFIFLNCLVASGQQYITSYTFDSGEYNGIYVPPSPNLTTNPYLAGLPETDFVITYIGNVPEVAKPGIEKATKLWGGILSTEVPIAISISFDTQVDGQIFANDILASTGTNIIKGSDFDASGDEPTPSDTTFYPTALANRIANNDAYINDVDMHMTINSNAHANNVFNYDTTAQTTTLIDFTTLVFHEIGHGLGVESSLFLDSNDVKLGYQDINDGIYYPLIFDRFVRHIVETKFLDEYPKNTASIELTEFVTSDSLIWGGWQGIYGLDNAYPNSPTKLYAPNDFSEAKSVAHLDEDTYMYNDSMGIASVDNHLLMTATLNPGEIIHSPGKRVAGMLADMGWELSLGGTGPSDYFYAIGPSEVDIDTGFSIGFGLIDEDDTGTTMGNCDWKLELLLENGETYSYTTGEFFGFYQSQESYTEGTTNVTVSSLPDDLDFVRNTKGQLIAKLTVSGNDSDTYFQTDSKPIKINVAPATPSVSHSIVNSNGCSAIELSFYAAGADTYRVYYQGEDDSYHYPAFVPEGQNTYILDNLDPTIDYDIFVGAYNEIDESFSASFVRPKCQISIEVYPNPTVQSIDIDSDSVIDHVEVRDIVDPSIGLNKTGDGSSSDINVNIDNLPMGTYSVKVVDENGNMVTKTIVKF